MDLNSLWRQIPTMVCINLLSRDDRYRKTQSIFQQYHMPVTFHRVKKHINGGVHGCYESHQQVIQRYLLDAGNEYIAIFEDDLDPGKITPERLANVLEFAENNKDWDLIYLGSRPEFLVNFFVTKPVQKEIYSTKPICAHAYLIHKRYGQRLVQIPYTGVPIDVEYLKGTNTYAVYPSLFYQGNSTSDIDPGQDIYVKLGVKKGLFQFSELYGIHVNQPLLYVAFLILLLVVVFSLWWKYNT